MRRRVAACFCAVLVLVNCTLFPLRVRATVGALAAVGAAVTVSAFLMACGVYPYISEDGQSFGEWGADSLYDLWAQYVDSFEGGNLPSGGTVETFNQIKSFVVGNTLAVASGTWETLRGFANWIVSHFSLTDNQQGIQLGTVTTSSVYLPVVASSPSASAVITSGLLLSYRTNNNKPLYCASNVPNICVGIVNGAPYAGALAHDAPFSARVYTCIPIYDDLGRNSVDTFLINAGSNSAVTYKGYSLHVSAFAVGNNNFADTTAPFYDTLPDFYEAIIDQSSILEGITADTTTVVPLEALPGDTPWGGLAVQGTSTPAEAVERGIMEREKPVVRPVEVEIGAGTEIDSETGEVTENPVVIDEADIVPAVSALTPPAAFLEALTTTMTTKFPFCLPFDVARILMAFYVEPEAPVISLTFHDPFTDGDYTITVDLSPWDDVAAVVRNFEAMILLAGFCLNFDKFNIIHLILGGLG